MFLLTALPAGVFAQELQPPADSLPPPAAVLPVDSLLSVPPLQRSLPVDTFPLADSLRPAAAPFRDGRPEPEVKIAEGGLDGPVDYTARDSMIYDLENQRVYLYGGAQIKYTGVDLTAAYIEFDWKNNTVRAKGHRDLLGRWQEMPTFSDGTQNLQAQEFLYNFETNKAVIYEVLTTQNDLYVRGEQAKLIRTETDTSHTDVIYNKNAIFTTCDHPEPHFGVRSRKQKVIADKVVVVGPSNVEIMGVPTPLWLPFGFFPVTKGKSTGLIFPQTYEYSPAWGFGFRNVGWYFPISEYMNLQLTTDIYLKGTYRLRATGNYNRRYKYNGRFFFEFSDLRNEDPTGNFVRDRAVQLTLSHKQDAKAHPSRNIGGNINIQTNNARSRNYNDAENVLATDLSSNFTYRESFPGKPYNLSVGLTHSQNTQSRDVTISFPTVNFQTQTLYPFKPKGRPSQDKWYEKVTLTYRGEARSELRGKDTTIFRKESIENIQFGARHDITSDASFKLGYFNINPRISYDEVWYFKTQEKYFDPTLVIVDDTATIDGELVVLSSDTTFGTVTDSINFGFKPLRKFNTGVNIDTKLFGTLPLKLGRLKGVRHVVTPSIGLSYTPDYTREGWGYFNSVRTDSRDPELMETYSVFPNGLYSGERPSSTAGQQLLLTYRLSSFVEAKVAAKRDTTQTSRGAPPKDRIIRLLRRLDLDGNYNFAADSLKFSTLRLSANSTLFGGLTSVILSATYDFYEINEKGNRIEQFVWDTRGKPLRFVDARASFSTTLTVKKIRDIFSGGAAATSGQGRSPAAPPGRRSVQEEGLLSVFENFNIRHNLVLQGQSTATVDTFFVQTNVITLNGNVPLTPAWRVSVGSFGYDFVNKKVTFPSLSISRDLHCWNMGLSWQPSRGTYAFFLRVDPGSIFDFINIPYQKGNQDAFFSGGFSGF